MKRLFNRSLRLAALALLLVPLRGLPVTPTPANQLARSVGATPSLLQSSPPPVGDAFTRWLLFKRPRLLYAESLKGKTSPQAKLEEELSTGAIRRASTNGAHWVSIGPDRIALSWTKDLSYHGRIDALAINPDNPDILFAGAPEGGLWRSTDGGASWTPITVAGCPGGVTSIAIDPLDHDLVYAVIYDGWDPQFPSCLLQSADSGQTWKRLSDLTGKDIRKILLIPRKGQQKSDILLGGYGGFLSTDGGATFTSVLSNQYYLDDLIEDTSSATPILYAADEMRPGVLKSTDGGQTWFSANTGLPQQTNSFYFTKLATSPRNPSRIFLVEQDGGSNVPRLFKSTDQAASWQEIHPTGATLNCWCWYDLTLSIDPSDPNALYFGGSSLFRSGDSGNTWAYLGVPHADFHALGWGNQGHLYVGSDGGIFRSSQPSPARGTDGWEDLNGNLSITEVYHAAVHPTNPGRVYLGAQDNGTSRALQPLAWQLMLGGDGGDILIDPLDPDRLYSHTLPAPVVIFRSEDDGATISVYNTKDIGLGKAGGWGNMVMNPLNPSSLLLGGGKVFRTTDRAQNWVPISPDTNISVVALSKSQPQIIYAGGGQGLWTSSDSGTSWQKKPDAESPFTLTPDPDNPAGIFEVENTIPRYSGDGGDHWQDINGNLPQLFASRVLVQHRDGVRRLLLATDSGVFVSQNEGATWQDMSQGLPQVPIMDLAYAPETDTLIAATYGRGVYELSCQPSDVSLCLNGGRFKVNAQWETSDGQSGTGHAVQLTKDTGYFWFFNKNNVEVVTKVLDGCSSFKHFWVFGAGLTNVKVHMTVTDTETGQVRTYTNSQGAAFQPIQDTEAFNTCSTPTPALTAQTSADSSDTPVGSLLPSPKAHLSGSAASCSATSGLCLGNGRFAVDADWTTADGKHGSAQGVQLTSDTGYLWFFNSSNIEVVLKVLDACQAFKHFWVFAAGMTNVQVELRITDTTTGQVRTYKNPQGKIFVPIQDTKAFDSCS